MDEQKYQEEMATGGLLYIQRILLDRMFVHVSAGDFSVAHSVTTKVITPERD
jgi:hypothetical protein